MFPAVRNTCSMHLSFMDHSEDLAMGTGRILRCRPGGTHGYDPVPLFIFKKYRSARIFKMGERKQTEKVRDK